MFCISLFLCQHCTYCFRYESFETAHAYRSYAISKLRSAISKLDGNFKIGGQFRNRYAISKFSNCATQFRNCAYLQFARNIYTSALIEPIHASQCIAWSPPNIYTPHTVTPLYACNHADMRIEWLNSVGYTH